MAKRMPAAGFAVVLFGILAAIGPSQLRAQRPPKGPLAPAQQLNVNCSAGQTIGDALAQAQGILGHVQINILGVCREVVLITRSDVTLMGVSREDGIEAPESTEYTLSIKGPNLVRLANLTIAGGGLGAYGGASFEADDITVRDAVNVAIAGDKGAFGILRNVTVQNSQWGVWVGSGAHFTLISSEIKDNWKGLNVNGGGTLRVESTTIEDNETGAMAFTGGVLDVQNSTFQDNSLLGLYLATNATASFSGASFIKNNGTAGPGGAQLFSGAVLDLKDSTVELNSGNGIEAQDGSVISLNNGIVRNNSGSGVFLGHASAVTGNGQINSNSGWGVQCTVPSAWIGGFGSVQIGANGQGATNDNCQSGT